MKSVLIIENVEGWVEDISNHLKAHNLRNVRSIEAAFAEIDSAISDYGCVIVDLQIPICDGSEHVLKLGGLDVVEHLRKTEIGRKVPLVVFTGQEDPYVLRKCREHRVKILFKNEMVGLKKFVDSALKTRR